MSMLPASWIPLHGVNEGAMNKGAMNKGAMNKDAINRVRAVVTSREHPQGMSRGPWASFNLGNHVGDSAATVLQHRRLLESALGEVVIQWCHQVHGHHCEYVGSASRHSVTADAAWTDQVGLVMAVLTADCVPILLWNDPGTKVAACHAGWRGLVANREGPDEGPGAVLDGVIHRTIQSLGEHPADLNAWIGPCIGVERYEVGADVWQNFNTPAWQSCLVSHPDPEKRFVDLGNLAFRQLQAGGVVKIEKSGICTYDHPDFYSHREYKSEYKTSGVDGDCGRFASLIWLEPIFG